MKKVQLPSDNSEVISSTKDGELMNSSHHQTPVRRPSQSDSVIRSPCGSLIRSPAVDYKEHEGSLAPIILTEDRSSPQPTNNESNHNSFTHSSASSSNSSLTRGLNTSTCALNNSSQTPWNHPQNHSSKESSTRNSPNLGYQEETIPYPIPAICTENVRRASKGSISICVDSGLVMEEDSPLPSPTQPDENASPLGYRRIESFSQESEAATTQTAHIDGPISVDMLRPENNSSLSYQRIEAQSQNSEVPTTQTAHIDRPISVDMLRPENDSSLGYQRIEAQSQNSEVPTTQTAHIDEPIWVDMLRPVKRASIPGDMQLGECYHLTRLNKVFFLSNTWPSYL